MARVLLHIAAMRRAWVVIALAGCYTGAPANRDIAVSWRGHAASEIADRWGVPHKQPGPPELPAGEVHVWSYRTTKIELPSATVLATPAVIGGELRSASGDVAIRAEVVDVFAAFRPGVVWRTTHHAAALIDPTPRPTIVDVRGEAIHWGPPNDENLHWGVVFGGHVGMGSLARTSTPLPSGGAYIGGMLSRQLALVGTYTLAAGTSRDGGALAMGWGIGAQYWALTRLWLRAGPTMLLGFDPGFTNGRLRPGASAAASYAFVKVGKLAVDLVGDLAIGPSLAFGTIGIGVNLN